MKSVRSEMGEDPAYFTITNCFRNSYGPIVEKNNRMLDSKKKNNKEEVLVCIVLGKNKNVWFHDIWAST